MSKAIVLWYLGGGFIQGVPARDLTEDDFMVWPVDLGVLLASGLYSQEQPERSVNVEIVTAAAPCCGQIDLRDVVNDGEASLAGRALKQRRA